MYVSVVLLICACHGPALTSGGGLAGVDVSDDDDVDMSLFLTTRAEDMSEMLIDIAERKDFDKAQMEFAYPMVAVVLTCSESCRSLVVLWQILEEFACDAQIRRLA